MKKLNLMFILLAIAGYVTAQNSGFSIRLNQTASINIDYTDNFPGFPADLYNFKVGGVSIDLTGFFSINDEASVRIRAGYRSFSFNSNVDYNYSSGSYDYYDYTLKNNSFVIAPGIGKNINNDNLTLTFGLELPIAIIGKTEYDSKDTYYNSFSGTTTVYTTESVIDGGVSIGLGTFLGMSYTLFGPFALGAEFSFGYKYTSVKGDMLTSNYTDGVLNTTDKDDFKVSAFGLIPLTSSLVLLFSF